MRRAGLALALLLAGCATAPKWPAGRSLLEGVTPTLPKPPDSLRASLELTALAGGRRSSVTAAFSAKPGRAYKLDLFGFPGVTAGGFLWRPEGWDLVLYDRAEYLEGAGDRVAIGAGLGEIPVHDLFSWLWGDFFPGDSALAGLPATWRRVPEGGYAYRGADGEWRADLDPETGLPRAVARDDSAFRIEFGAWRAGAGAGAPERPVPRRAKVFRYGEPLLEIKVSLVEDDPAWKRDPFVLRIPKGFRRAAGLKDR